MVAAEVLNPRPAEGQPQHWRPGVASLTLPLQAGTPCGDLAFCRPWPSPADASACLLAIVDGLGHGPAAALAAEAAQGVLAAAEQAAAPDLPRLMQALDRALASLRGAALGLMYVHAGQLDYAAVGNTRALCWRGQQFTRLPSQNGIVGGGLAAPVLVQRLAVLPGDCLLLFTDGLDERLPLSVPWPEWQRDPGLLCQHLMQHARLGRDDAGVLALQVAAA